MIIHPSMMLRSIATFSLLAAVVSGQCATVDHANCANWKKNGMCTNPAYAKSQLQQFCPFSCGNESGCNPTPGTGTGGNGGNTGGGTSPPKVPDGEDANKNCGKWNKREGDANFCTSTTMSADDKKKFCAKTCKFEITPDNDCAVYSTVDATKEMTLNKAVKKADPAVMNEITYPAQAKLGRVMAKNGCTVGLYKDKSKPVTDTPDTKVVGTATTTFFEPVTTDANGFTCTCTP